MKLIVDLSSNNGGNALFAIDYLKQVGLGGLQLSGIRQSSSKSCMWATIAAEILATCAEPQNFKIYAFYSFF